MNENNIILVDNAKAESHEFQALMTATDASLNADASVREDYYVNRNGKALEEDVVNMLNNAAVGTSFEGTIELVSAVYRTWQWLGSKHDHAYFSHIEQESLHHM